jgi:hypothetical protein
LSNFIVIYKKSNNIKNSKCENLMSDNDPNSQKPKPVARLIGKTTVHTLNLLISDPNVDRTSYFVIYGDVEEEGKEAPYFILSIIDIWNDSKGTSAKVIVLGDRPKRPFGVGTEVYLATEEQITTTLGIYNPPEKSVALGKLLGHPFQVYLAVKNFGRIFVTGKSGSGKSYTMGVLCEEFMRKGIPIVILDRHGEYGSLKVAADEEEEEKPKVMVAIEKLEAEEFDLSEIDISGATARSPKKEGPKESIFVENIIEFADLSKNRGGDIDIDYLFSLDATDIVAPRLCTIVNLRGLDLEVQEIVAGKLLKKLYSASTDRKIPPFYLFLDEAHLFAGKKATETCEVVKLFAQEGRKFGANIVIGTQRPQLLDTTIRAQAGTWIVMNLSDIRDIDITIKSAEDLSKEHRNDISGLDKGEGIISGEAVAGIPIFVKVRKRLTAHGGIGFNPLDFLSENTIEEAEKRRNRLLGNKTKEELEAGKMEYKELTEMSSSTDYIAQITKLKARIRELEDELEGLKSGTGGVSAIPHLTGGGNTKELEMEVKVWKEKYNALKKRKDSEIPTPHMEALPSVSDNSEQVLNLQNKISFLESQVEKYKQKAKDSIKLAERLMNELKGKR